MERWDYGWNETIINGRHSDGLCKREQYVFIEVPSPYLKYQFLANRLTEMDGSTHRAFWYLYQL